MQMLAAAAAIGASGVPEIAAQTNSKTKVRPLPPTYFDVNAAYTEEELVWLYRRKRLHPKSQFFDAQLNAAAASRDSLLFYWDDSKKKLTNPYNLTADPSIAKGKQYTINADVLNFHPS